MSRRILFLSAVLVAVDCSLLGFGLQAVDNKALLSTAVNSVKQPHSTCACRRQCVKDKDCTGVTTFKISEGSFECHFSSEPHDEGGTLVDDDSRTSVSTLIKVAEPTYPATTKTSTTTTTTTTAMTAVPTTTPPSCPPIGDETTCDSPYQHIVGLGCFYFSISNEDSVNYHDAKAECAALHGTMASLCRPGELERMNDHFRSMHELRYRKHVSVSTD